MRNIQFLKDLYPAGTRVKLLEMNDIQAPPIGTFATCVDENGKKYNVSMDDISFILPSITLKLLNWKSV